MDEWRKFFVSRLVHYVMDAVGYLHLLLMDHYTIWRIVACLREGCFRAAEYSSPPIRDGAWTWGINALERDMFLIWTGMVDDDFSGFCLPISKSQLRLAVWSLILIIHHDTDHRGLLQWRDEQEVTEIAQKTVLNLKFTSLAAWVKAQGRTPLIF